jgi:hypothetical protein
MIDRDENMAPDGTRAGAASPVKNGFALGDAPPPWEPEEEPREAEGSALPLPLGSLGSLGSEPGLGVAVATDPPGVEEEVP